MAISVKGLLSRIIEIPPERYMIDLELHDRYCQFSAELLKLSLAGVAAVGFFISTLTHQGNVNPILRSWWFSLPSMFSVICLAFSAGSALLHRYLAADGMFHHFRAMKYLTVIESCDPNIVDARAAIRRKIASDEATRNEEFKWCGWILFVSSVLVFLGAIALSVSLIAILK